MMVVTQCWESSFYLVLKIGGIQLIGLKCYVMIPQSFQCLAMQ